VWLEIGKPGDPEATVSYAEAVEIALCYGWIDGRKKAKDATHWLQRFTPRRPRSMWSKVNRVPADLQAALDARPKARAFFSTLNAANRYAVLWRVQTAKKPQTRASRIETLVAMLARGDKIHP
jgi:uncharacterized protein YdeI (YjbR/CyaY-like superfamily)